MLSKHILTLAISCLILPVAHAKEAVAPPTETSALTINQLEAQLAKTLKKVRNTAVSVKIGGSASGSIITKDGLVMTAAHVLIKKNPKDKATIQLEDGRKFKASILGADLENDFGLLKIDNPPKEGLQHVQLAEKTPAPGNYCFVLAHPSGLLKGRPAQLRLGRIRHHRFKDDKIWLFKADSDIQPGDSGGPVYDLNGQLIGVSSSAANIPGFNRFGAIEQFHSAREFLMQPGAKRGNFDLGPGGKAGYSLDLKLKALPKFSATLQKQLRDKHQQSLRFVKSRQKNGEIHLSTTDLANFMSPDLFPVLNDTPMSYGLDDPLLLKPLMGLKKTQNTQAQIFQNGKKIAHGTRFPNYTILVKNSLLQDESPIQVTLGLEGKQKWKATILTRNQDWDIAILQLPEEAKGISVNLQNSAPSNEIVAGSLLVALDQYGDVVLGAASDSARPVTKARSVGPVGKNIKISKHRSPFPAVIRHTIQLYADDAGLPVYDIKGRFVGIHIARYSRTMGLIIPASDIKDLLKNN